jgi:DNA-directed RNA polymerase subunit E'
LGYLFNNIDIDGENLYYVYTINDTFSVIPENFNKKIEGVTQELLRNKYERTIDKDLGVILSVFNIRDISNGRIFAGDPSIHHDVKFDILTFKLEVDEVFVGEVSEMLEFGCFIRIGPMEGLVHLSQITGDFMTYDRKSGTFVSKNTGRTIKKGDMVYAKVSTISMKDTVKDTKVALTMRPEGLGKQEWILEIPRKEKSGQRRGGRQQQKK